MKNGLFILLLSTFLGLFLSRIGLAEADDNTTGDAAYQAFSIGEAKLPSSPPGADINDPSDIKILEDFTYESTRRLIEDRETDNFLYSPLSLWFCLHTLADLTEGESRAQILRVIGQYTDEERDAQLSAVFQSLYRENASSACIPAMSVWLDDDTDPSQALLDRLTAHYSSVFRGDMGDAGYDTALQAWLNEQTRGLLAAPVSQLRFSPDEELSVCSTLYYKNGWLFRFDKEETAPGSFHSESGELITDFMHRSFVGVVYRRDGFSSVTLDFEDGGGVTFLLPDTGVSPEELLNREDVFQFLFSEENREEGQLAKINLSVPRIDTMTDMSLKNQLKRLGIVDIFDSERADFSSELSSNSAISVPDIHQYARLVLNEEGVEAAAITISLDGAPILPPENKLFFTLDRPFLYALMSEQYIPLFIGMYCTP